jgi:hypothetical protein
LPIPTRTFPILLALILLAQALTPLSLGQRRRVSRNGAHSSAERAAFTPADRRVVERAIGQACAERIRDPFSSMAIDEMQARPSLPVGHPDAVAGLRRAERVLPTTRRLVVSTIIQLAKEYDLYGTAVARSRVNAATARVEAVRRIRPDVDSRDNASVLLREPRTIEFGTIFLAGLRSDEAMMSVLAHELTHIASGQADSLRPLFRAIARRAASRTGLRIQGQRAEELSCDLVGMMAARQFIKETPSWEPLPRRLARAVEHNCVDDDASDEDHLSPRSTIRALFALDVSLAGEVLTEGTAGWLLRPQPTTIAQEWVKFEVKKLLISTWLQPGVSRVSESKTVSTVLRMETVESATTYLTHQSTRTRVLSAKGAGCNSPGQRPGY